jgi:site-specific DNA-methyltransferase (adenine-specific)
MCSIFNYELFQSDAVKWLKTLDYESVDLIVTDPPYESIEKHRKIGTTTRLKISKSSSNTWFKVFPNNRFPELLSEIYRVLKKNSHFYIFCDNETMFVLKPIAEAAGFKFWKPLVWDKMKIGMGYHYRCRYEFILFFEKGKRKLSNLSIPDIFQVPRIFRGYPAEKPTAISKIFLEQSSTKGDLVIDPFMGSSSVGEAAITMDRKYFGNDISEEALAFSRTRLEKLFKDEKCHQAPSIAI